MSTQLTPIDPAEMVTSPAFAQGMIVPAGPVLFVGHSLAELSNFVEI